MLPQNANMPASLLAGWLAGWLAAPAWLPRRLIVGYISSTSFQETHPLLNAAGSLMSNLESQPLKLKSHFLAALMAPNSLSCHLLINNTFFSSLNFPMYSRLRQSKLTLPSPAGIALSDFSLGAQTLKRKEGGREGGREGGSVTLWAGGSIGLSEYSKCAVWV